MCSGQLTSTPSNPSTNQSPPSKSGLRARIVHCYVVYTLTCTCSLLAVVQLGNKWRQGPRRTRYGHLKRSRIPRIQRGESRFGGDSRLPGCIAYFHPWQIIYQRRNGPCSLLAICNILILRGDVEILPPGRDTASYEYLSSLVADFLVSGPGDASNADLSAALSVLPSTSVRTFEF